MNNIFILEDNVKTLEFLCDLIKEKRTQEKVFCFSDIESGYAALKSTKIFNIFFGSSGVMVGKKTPQPL